MKEKLLVIKNSQFVRNVSIVATGTVGAHVISIAVSPIITRLYGPEAFGIMGTFNSLMSIIIPIAALTYPYAIVLPKKDEEAVSIMRLSIIISILISLILLFIIVFLKELIVNTFKLKEIELYLFLIPLVVIFAGLMKVIEQWKIRKREFKVNAQAMVLESTMLNGTKVGVGFFYPLASVLVITTAIQEGVRALLLIVLSKPKKFNLKNIFKKKQQFTTKYLVKKYYDFPLFRAPEAFFNSITRGLPVLLLTAFFGPASAGFYTIGRTVLAIPSRLIGKSIGDVFYPRVAEAANNNENLSEIIKKATYALALLGIIPFGIVMAFGPFLFSFVFGSSWYVAGEYARWISLWSFSTFINRPSIRSLAVLNAQKFHLLFTVLNFVMGVTMLTIGFKVFDSDNIAIALFSISGAILNLGIIFMSLSISKKRSGKKLR